MRHINVKSLWLQEKQVQAELDYEKIKGEENPSDGLTKHVRQELAERYAATVGYKFTKDRAKASLDLAGTCRGKPNTQAWDQTGSLSDTLYI